MSANVFNATSCKLPPPEPPRASVNDEMHDSFVLPNANVSISSNLENEELQTNETFQFTTPYAEMSPIKMEECNKQQNDNPIQIGEEVVEITTGRTPRERRARIFSDFLFPKITASTRRTRKKRKPIIKPSNVTELLHRRFNESDHPTTSKAALAELGSNCCRNPDMSQDSLSSSIRTSRCPPVNSAEQALTKIEQPQKKPPKTVDNRVETVQVKSNIKSPSNEGFVINENVNQELDLISIMSILSQRNSNTDGSINSDGSSHRSGSVSIGDQKITLFTSQIYLIGRKDPDFRDYLVDVSIDSVKVDEKHAIIEVCDDGRTFIIDLRSRYGTLLNGIPIRPLVRAPAKNNDSVTFGDKNGKLEILDATNSNNHQMNTLS